VPKGDAPPSHFFIAPRRGNCHFGHFAAVLAPRAARKHKPRCKHRGEIFVALVSLLGGEGAPEGEAQECHDEAGGEAAGVKALEGQECGDA
jgi:hypothetical protein